MSDFWQSVSRILKEPFGIIPALSTITNETGELDEESERSLVQANLGWGARGVAASIVAGEFYKFTDEERVRTFEIVMEAANGKTPVWAGISHLGTQSSIKLARQAKDVGVYGVIAQAPLAGKEASLALYEHFSCLFQKVDIPIMIQDAEDFNGIHIDPNIYRRLADEFSQFVSVKIEGGKTLDKIREVKALMGDRLTILGGMGGRLILEELQLGAVGSIPNPCMTDLVVNTLNKFNEGKMKEAKESFSMYEPWLEFQTKYKESSFEIVKETLRLRGVVKSSATRSPHVPMSEQAKTELRNLIRKMNMLAV